jgi:hypothetical protein
MLLLTWHQWMEQPTISKKQVKGSHAAVQHLMRMVATVAPRPGGMMNNPIKRRLVLHLYEDILDHGVPDNVNSLYAESAHIPLAKITSQNTQKRAVSFTKQAAHCYVKNLVISLALADVKNNIQLKGSGPGNGPLTAAQLDTPLSGRKSGRNLELTWSVGNEGATFIWNRPYPSNNLEMAHLLPQVSKFLSEKCMPKMPLGELPCFTSFIHANGDWYRAHPCYDGKVWNDHALINWEKYPLPYPAFIHTFVDLHGLPEGESIYIKLAGKRNIKAGLYAVAHSFSPVGEDDITDPLTLIAQYTPYFHRPDHTRPTLYLVDVELILSPIVGIADVIPFGAKIPRRERHHLFLNQRKAAWPQAWDAIIDMCRCEDNLEDTVFEPEYEKVEKTVHKTVITVKTAADVAAEVAAAKAAKVAAKKKKEDDAADKVAGRKTAATIETNLNATQIATPQPGGHSRRKRGPP